MEEEFRAALVKVRLEPGDVLIVRFPDPVPAQVLEKMQQQFAAVFPNNHSIFLQRGADISVFTPA